MVKRFDELSEDQRLIVVNKNGPVLDGLTELEAQNRVETFRNLLSGPDSPYFVDNDYIVHVFTNFQKLPNSKVI